VVGACIGYYLADEGADVMLVDAGHPGEVTTSASFAWVNASSKADHRAYFDLNFAGLKEYEQLLAQFEGATWWHPTGHLRWDYRDEAELVNHVEQLRARGYPAEVWEARRVKRLLEPNVVFASPSAPVALFPSEAWVDGPKMVQALVAAAVEKRATTAFGTPVRAITVSDGAVTSVELAGGATYAVGAVVNAAGRAAPSVAALVGRIFPMKDQPGLAVRIATGKDWVHRVVHAPEIAMRPDGPGRGFLLARSVEPALNQAARISSHLVEIVTRLATQVVPDLRGASVLEARVGHRAIPADGLPALGKASQIAGYYEAVMHSGITLGPIAARTLTAEILHGDIDPLAASFRATRLASA